MPIRNAPTRRLIVSEAILFVGPVFTREATTAPRRPQFHILPALAVGTLLALVWTYWQLRTGRTPFDSPGLAARFGDEVFSFLAPVVLAVSTLFSALLTAAAVSQEKDRKTLILLLLTRLSNSELVIGKLLASLLVVLLVVAVSLPFFMFLVLLGGISYEQVARVMMVSLASGLVAGSLGSTVALWREKTFQALAVTCLTMVLWLLAWEGVAGGAFGDQLWGLDAESVATAMSPWRAVQVGATSDVMPGGAASMPTLFGLDPVAAFLLVSLLGIVLLNGIAIAMVRVWNPSRGARAGSAQQDEAHSIWLKELENNPQAGVMAAQRAQAHKAPGKLRSVWDNPILWREMCTWAYGKKILFVRFIYLLLVALCGVALYSLLMLSEQQYIVGEIPVATKPIVPLMVVSAILLNALAVTTITNERDGKALDLLLVTDLTAKEIIFGKLGGVIYNAKEMIVLPLLLCGYVWYLGESSTENLVFTIVGYLIMLVFSAVLGLHCGMTYSNSRQAVGVSIGTLLFLFIGISICMRMMTVLDGQFNQQFVTFLGFILGGGLGLYVAVGWRLQSPAIFFAMMLLPFLTFFVITSFLQAQYGSVILVTAIAYGFATASMLVPAVAEFDVATGRTGEQRE